MSKFDALLAAGRRVIRGGEEPQVQTKPKRTATDEYLELVGLAQQISAIDPQSATWQAIAGWAARELLTARTRWERPGTSDAETIALRERTRVLKDLLNIRTGTQHAVPKPLEDVGPQIP